MFYFPLISRGCTHITSDKIQLVIIAQLHWTSSFQNHKVIKGSLIKCNLPKQLLTHKWGFDVNRRSCLPFLPIRFFSCFFSLLLLYFSCQSFSDPKNFVAVFSVILMGNVCTNLVPIPSELSSVFCLQSFHLQRLTFLAPLRLYSVQCIIVYSA